MASGWACIKTQTCARRGKPLQCCSGLLASGQISLRKVDGWRTLDREPFRHRPRRLARYSRIAGERYRKISTKLAAPPRKIEKRLRAADRPRLRFQ